MKEEATNRIKRKGEQVKKRDEGTVEEKMGLREKPRALSGEER